MVVSLEETVAVEGGRGVAVPDEKHFYSFRITRVSPASPPSHISDRNRFRKHSFNICLKSIHQMMMNNPSTYGPWSGTLKQRPCRKVWMQGAGTGDFDSIFLTLNLPHPAGSSQIAMFLITMRKCSPFHRIIPLAPNWPPPFVRSHSDNRLITVAVTALNLVPPGL